MATKDNRISAASMREAELELQRWDAIRQLEEASQEELPRLLQVFEPKTFPWRNDG